MEPKDVLIDHLSLCQEVYNVLIEENTWLKTKKSSPSIDIIDRKKEMLPRLEKSLQNLKRLKPEFFSPFDNTKNWLMTLILSSYKFSTLIEKMKNYY